MNKEEVLECLVDPSYKEVYIRGLSSYYDHVEIKCPQCGQIYFSTYGNRFNTDGSVKKTLLCKSCSARKKSQKNPDPEEGERFGNLTFVKRIEDKVNSKGKHYIQYLCRCDCGNNVEVNKDNLLKGAVLHCKQCKTSMLIEASRNKGNKSDPDIGTRFGKLVFLEKIYHTDSKGRNTQFYRCKCDCGNTTEVAKHSILAGLTKSCGCQGSRNKLREKRIAIGELTDPSIGSKYGKLTVLRIIPPEDGGEKHIECQCECGNITQVRKASLLGGKQKTCGRCPNHYPQWFIDRLLDESDRQKAIAGILQTPERVCVSCPRCGSSVKVSVNNLINLSTQEPKRLGFCKKCSHHTSKEEEEIHEFLLSLGLSESQILRNNRAVLKSGGSIKELDFYLPDYHLAIEYNGSYYHSENRKPKGYHQDKFLSCEKEGIRLISLFEMDWETNKEKLLDLIRYSILPKKKVLARKCVVKEVSKDVADAFYDAYHIQNKSILAKINIGLYYNSELLAVMGFGSSSFHNRQRNEGDYELHRFVTKSGYTIVGGASKLLSHFEREFKPRFLLSYSWNDWFSGDMYSKLGFVLEHLVPPDYYWYLSGDCINKRQCRLKSLSENYPELYQQSIENKAPNKEDYIMLSLGSIKVYRSGSKRWVKRYQ